ncbi:hypothetical protein vseg_001794 [Gypsophila vaccaria]
MASMSSTNITLPSSYLSESSTTSLRDAPLSPYQNSTDETYIPGLRLKKAEDDEIDVFSADKYFNEVIDQESNTVETMKYHQQVQKNQTDKAMISLSKIKLRPRTPSIHSDSSWNSQSALIRPVQRTPSQNNNSKKKGKTSFFLSCYCCGKKSVDVKDQDSVDNQGDRSFDSDYSRGITKTIKTSFDTAEITRLNKLRLDRTDPFAYPQTDPLTSVKTVQEEEEEEGEIRRKKSIEVFGYKEETDIKRPNTLPDDTDSDSSSDLFEIQCLSCNASPESQGPRHDSIGYAPSEASIAWSVVTASAADNSTVLGSEDQLSSTLPPGVAGLKSSSYVKEQLKKGGQRPRSVGMLSGCKNQKAVDVHTSNVKRKSSECQRVHRFSDSYDTVTRFQVEARMSGHGLSQSNRISTSHRMYN